MKVYCPYCPSNRPMWKAGTSRSVRLGGRMVEKQMYKCPACHRSTVNPGKQPLVKRRKK